MGNDTPTALGALQIDETKLKGHVDEVVRSSVEETLNGLLDAEADRICRAQRYEHSPERVDTRAGHYEERTLETKAGAVTLKMPKLRSLPFERAIIERRSWWSKKPTKHRPTIRTLQRTGDKFVPTILSSGLFERSGDEREWSAHLLTVTRR